MKGREGGGGKSKQKGKKKTMKGRNSGMGLGWVIAYSALFALLLLLDDYCGCPTHL